MKRNTHPERLVDNIIENNCHEAKVGNYYAKAITGNWDHTIEFCYNDMSLATFVIDVYYKQTGNAEFKIHHDQTETHKIKEALREEYPNFIVTGLPTDPECPQGMRQLVEEIKG